MSWDQNKNIYKKMQENQEGGNVENIKSAKVEYKKKKKSNLISFQTKLFPFLHQFEPS